MEVNEKEFYRRMGVKRTESPEDGKEKRKEFECRELAEWFTATLIVLFEKEAENGVLQFRNSVKKFVTFSEKTKENNEESRKQSWYNRKV